MKLQYIFALACACICTALVAFEKQELILMSQTGKYATDKPATKMTGSSLQKGDVVTGSIDINGKIFKIRDLKSLVKGKVTPMGDYFVKRVGPDTLTIVSQKTSK